MGKGGLDALVTLGQGDMRRTLNILQVRPTVTSRHSSALDSQWTWQHPIKQVGDVAEHCCNMLQDWKRARLKPASVQATYMSSDVVSEDTVYKCTGSPLPKDIEAIVNALFNKNFEEVFEKIRDMQVQKGLALTDIVQQLHP